MQFLGVGEIYDLYCKTTFDCDCCNDFGTSRALITYHICMFQRAPMRVEDSIPVEFPILMA